MNNNNLFKWTQGEEFTSETMVAVTKGKKVDINRKTFLDSY